MARLPRFVIPGHPQHIIVRGNNREAIFYEDDDYTFYRDESWGQPRLKNADSAISLFVLM